MKYMLSGNDWKLTGYWKNQWRFIKSMELGETMCPAVAPIPATVPGAVQADLIKAGVLEDPNLGLNSNKLEWVNNREWIYEKEFILTDGYDGDKYILVFEGLDYSGVIFLNEEEIGSFSGMFKPVELDVTGLIEKNRINRLKVVFHQAPEVDGQYGFTNRIRHLKSRFNYVWDWCPRLVSTGIWKDVYLIIYKYACITDLYPCTFYDTESGKGRISLELETDALVPGEYLVETVISHNGREIHKAQISNMLRAARQKISTEIEIEQAEAWWPNGYGKQPLYTVQVSLIHNSGTITDSAEKRVGFHKAEFTKNAGTTDTADSYTMVINESRIFIRGVNWVPVSPFYGTVTREHYRNYIKRFKDMNCNLLRVWGGAIPEKEDFYDICDEMGILVWQEFPQSSSGINNTPPDDPQYLAELKQVAYYYIRDKRHHASHIIWCGGNELMWEDGKPVDERHANIKMLKELVDSMDKGKKFIPASASGPTFIAGRDNFGKGIHHDVHGPWNYLGEAEHYDYFNHDDSLFRSETGCPGTARLETLDKHKGSFSVWPPDKTNPYWTHRGAWWLQLEQLTGLFGAWAPNGEETGAYLKASRYLQAEALRYAIEATRRREPVSSGFIIWMGNEPFPNNANTSVIEYDGTPKPAYYLAGDAYSAFHVSAIYGKLAYVTGEKFTCEIYLTSDSCEGRKNRVTGQILDTGGNVLLEKEWEAYPEVPNSRVGNLSWMVSPCSNNLFFLRLASSDGLLKYENLYIFTADSTVNPLKPLRMLPETRITVHEEKNGTGSIKAGDEHALIVTNECDVAAVNVFLYGKEPEHFLEIFPNYITLMPGESRKISVLTGGTHNGKDYCKDVSEHKINKNNLVICIDGDNISSTLEFSI